jgi:DNA-directed RNA polymerase subunit M/transcription elongation factor TFIIS
MHFCENCNNMYYLKVADADENSLIYYCRNCGNEDTKLTSSIICVSKTQIKRSEQKYSHIINEYTKMDPTLPRINTIRCPNQTCQSNKDEIKREVIYIRYDDINMKYIYLCAVCDTMWKTDEQK